MERSVYHKGITREQIVDTATRLIEEQGIDHFSLHLLAETLGVRTPSLYKHIVGLDELITEVGLRALERQRDAQLRAMEGLNGDEAVFAMAEAYRRFAQENPEIYRAILAMMSANETLADAVKMITEPVMLALSQYDLTEYQRGHWQRVLRSFMHGFIAHEEAGFFIHFNQEKELTYHMGIQCFLDGMKAEIKRRKQETNP